MHCLIILSNLQNHWQIAHLDRTYSSPAKKYILLCNKAQTDYEIKVCGCVHGNNKQTTPLGLPNHQSPCFLRGGGGVRLLNDGFITCFVSATSISRTF